MVWLELPVLVSQRHALVLGHGPRYHLLHTLYALSVTSLLTAVLDEQFGLTLVQSFEFSDQSPLLSFVKSGRICGAPGDVSVFNHRIAYFFGLRSQVALIAIFNACCIS